MARPKEFDRDEALRKATEVFWKSGYEATSVADLARAMGIGRQSLYDTFRDKHALFTEALELYKRERSGSVTCALAEAAKPLDAVRKLFHDVADLPLELKKRGCLMVNTTMEVCPDDASVTRLVRDNRRLLSEAVRGALVRAAKAKELPAGEDPERLARYLLAGLNGLYVTAKTEHDPAILHDIADHILSVLER